MTHRTITLAFAAGLALASLLARPAAAQNSQQTPPSPPPMAATQYLAGWMSANITLDRYLQGLRTQFRQADADANGEISAADIALHDAVTGAMMRGMDALNIMNADLDGDGTVTEDELRQKLRYNESMRDASRSAAATAAVPPSSSPSSADQSVEQEAARLMAADTNKDGRITWLEAIEFTKARPNYLQTAASGHGPAVRQLLALAPAGKDVVTLANVEAAGEALFRVIDADGNGTISQEELNAYRTRRSAEQLAEQREKNSREAEEKRLRQEAETRAVCAVPKASDNAKVLLLSAHDSDAISTTTIGSQDVETHTGFVAVEPGTEPLYVVIATYSPVIWRVTGAVERIERLVLSSGRTSANSMMPEEVSLAGATGIPAERVGFLKSKCLSDFSETPSTQAARAAAFVRSQVGKEPELTAGRSKVSGFAVPSGEVRTTGRSDQPLLVIQKPAGTLTIQGGANVVVQAGISDLSRDIANYYPGGVVEVDPASVVASQPAARYEVLPSKAGLLQLFQNGALGRNRAGEFLIKQKIRFPAGLYGAHSAKFLLLRGVPKPDGDPGHSEVISEETGERVNFDKPPG
jgi:Ca2+-binding EF-hand superfamily protein